MMQDAKKHSINVSHKVVLKHLQCTGSIKDRKITYFSSAVSHLSLCCHALVDTAIDTVGQNVSLVVCCVTNELARERGDQYG